MRWVSAALSHVHHASLAPYPHERHQYGKGTMLRVPSVSQDTAHGETRCNGVNGVGTFSNTPHATPQAL